jgi:hypothetical protein
LAAPRFPAPRKLIVDDFVPTLGRPAWADHTTLQPLAAAAFLALAAAMLIVPRRWAVFPLLASVCFIPSAQRVVVFSLNFDLLRLMVVVGCLRLVARDETRSFRWKRIDLVLVLWTVCSVIATVARCQMGAPVITKLGDAYDALGLYFLFRCLVRERRDVEAICIALVVLVIPVALGFGIEYATGHNLFAAFGGVPEYTMVREGRLRCQGAFSHPILAGCFWAAAAPMVASLWWTRPDLRRWVVLGLLACGFIIACCASSTPIMAVLAAGVAASLYPLRYKMRFVRWGVVACLLAAHLVMNAPVWHLFARIGVVGGSTGWHRYHLIDQAIAHFDEWWLCGTTSTLHWDEFGLLQDVTNQFVAEGVHGGALTLLLFAVMIGLAFQGVGRRCRLFQLDRPEVITAWALGVALFTHCINFTAVTYFGQIIALWYLQLALVGSITPSGAPGPVSVPVALPRRRVVMNVPTILMARCSHGRTLE